MDSQATLVNPSPPTHYFFSTHDLHDTTIYAQPSVPLYRITSNARRTEIWDTTSPDRLIAVIHRRDFLSDTVSFSQQRVHGGRSMKTVSIQHWLRRSKIFDSIPTFTVDTAHGPYLWRLLSRSQAKMYPDYDLERPVATCYFSSSSRADKPTIVVQADGEILRDEIVVAYCVQQHRVMLENKALDVLVGQN